MDLSIIRAEINNQEWDRAFDLLAAPLQEALWKNGSFETFLELIPPIERVVLCLAYIRGNLMQGGYIQVFQNGYAPLLMWAIQSAQELKFQSVFWQSLDAALKVYVINHEILSKEYSVEEFARFYQEFREFEHLEQHYLNQEPEAIREIMNRVVSM